ncbi:bifunctional 2-polyprenyl-6-hydroxyphenol methylase/3-demethylubiquinol 3-O-methyltransferase UbiG [Sneathiella sp.]|uniref:class I SAM-dependent methyltransferase n=1 Tax=Sneathiella sp. TaxID=1964365 RepID=UPI00260B7230|nr:class I SAM-dependent methyltransferase [Sneathiella sp.]MDF2366790.1 class I SAM-dependent methyltransferase [Sneathiella sp.]
MELPGTAAYTETAERLIPRFEALAFDDVHAVMLDLMPVEPVCLLDIGAGTGRDAAHFAVQGHQVTAVEPTDALRNAGQKIHAAHDIEWIDDGLPELAALAGRKGAFDFILLAGVWMHLDMQERIKGMQVLASLMSPGASLIMSLRHGPIPRGRQIFEVTGAATIELAKQAGLRLVRERHTESIQPDNQANGVHWTMLAFQG